MPNRHKSRQSALEVLYGWESGGREQDSIPVLLAGRLRQSGRRDQDETYLKEAVGNVTAQIEALDALVSRAVGGRKLERLGVIELSVLRLAIWEMKERLEIPYKVIINEAINLTRSYADEHATSLVNAALDHIARQLRKAETAPARQ